MKSLDKDNIEDILALTPMQEGMLFHYLKEPESSYYFEQLSLEISGKINTEFFEKAWNFVIETNEMLRTVFRWEKIEHPIQIILAGHTLHPQYFDFSGNDFDEIKKRLEEVKLKDREHKFDLHEVPFRVTLCKLGEDKYEIIIGNHHILYDGWSNGIILKEFFTAYHALCNGERSIKPPVKTPFKEFIKYIQSQDKNIQEHFWGEYLNGIDTPTVLPIKKRRGEVKCLESVSLILAKDIKDKLDVFVNNNRVTLAPVFYTAWGILLQKYCGCDDVIFGTTVSGRSAEVKGIEEMVGLFINTIPMRVYSAPGVKIIDVLTGIENLLREREKFESTSLVDIGSYSPAAGSGSLFDTIVAVENYPLDSRLLPEDSWLSVHSYSIVEMTHYDLAVGIMPFNEIEIKFSFKQELFDKETIENLAGHFKGIVRNIIENPGSMLFQLEIISIEGKNRILYEFNNTAAEYPGDKTIHRLFEEQADRIPDHIALGGKVNPKFEIRNSKQIRNSNDQNSKPEGTGGLAPLSVHISITYKELNLRSGRLAGWLIEKGVLADNIVGIMMERSVEMIIGILGILKSGAAYLPLNPEQPEARTHFMLKDSGAKLLVTTGTLAKPLESPTYPFIFLPSYLQNSSNLAYIIYTSGSTGWPKGVAVEHSQVVNFVFHMYNQYDRDVGVHDRCLGVTNIMFDVSVWECFLPLSFGARLYILPEQERFDVFALVRAIGRERITLIYLPPALLEDVCEQLKKQSRWISLNKMLVGVEPIRDEVLEGYMQLNPGMKIINGYGPTETTICATSYNYLSHEPLGEIVPIGVPLSNLQVILLDSAGHIIPQGIPGEICISGGGVSRGYINNPGLTSDKFDHDLKDYWDYHDGYHRPYRSHKSYIIYHTGDLARWLKDGNIEFLGRIDNQVKIRGFRIEPGEIEKHLLEHREVKGALVTAREYENGDKYLCAYIVPQPGCSPHLFDTLKEYLSGHLPDYMMPAYFVTLDRIPLNPNGKVNLKALPGPEIAMEENLVMPGSEIEMKLAAIWNGVLGIDHNKIGIDSDFFRLGGHSLKVMRLASRINRELDLTISQTQLFRLPTIRAQARYLREMEQGQKVEYIPFQPAPTQEYYDLSYAQRRLWIICQFEEDSIAYNEVGGLSISGKFNPAAFEQAVQAMAQRHESLRTVFVIIDGEPKQKILPQVELKLQQEDLRHLKGAEQEAAAALIIKNTANKAFHLEKGPLAMFKLLHLEDEKYFLLVNIHHIINDGWSVGVIKNEINTLYDYYNKNRSIAEEFPLAPLKFQYKDYTLWHNRLIKSGYFDKFKDYWLEKFKEKPTGLELPLDHARGSVQTFNGGRVFYRIEEKEVSALRQLLDGEGEHTTTFMKLMTLLSILLHKYSGEKDIFIGSPIAGRKQPELHHMIGFLVNTLVYRIQVEPGESFRQLLLNVKQETLACYENQDYPFDILVENLGLARDLSRSPLFNVLMAFGDEDTRGEDIRFDWAKVEFHDQVEGFNPSVFDLVFFFNEKGKELDCEIMYNSDLFERSTIHRLAANFLTLLKNVLQDREKPIFDLEYIEKREYEAVVDKFNCHREDFHLCTIQESVEKQVEKSPNRVAAVSPEGWAITYEEINKRANWLAHYLRRKYCMGPGKIVGICIERSIEMIIAVLGVVKSGAGYLSFDPNYPRDRVQHMIEDSRAGLVIIDRSRPDLFEPGEEKKSGQTLLDIHEHWPSISGESPQDPEIQNELSDAVYVIYTSGSTGTPNGAMLSHALLSNLVQWQAIDTDIDGSLRCLQFTSINFCVSFQEIFITLSSGGEVHLIGDIERQDIDYLVEFLARRRIGNLYLPFSYLNFLFNLSSETGEWDKSHKTSLQHIITAGEQLKITSGLKKFLDRNPWIKLHNHYGSSEMHVVTSYTLDAASAGSMPVPPAGKPIANTRIYILDEYERPVPIGVWGELFVDGSSQVLGYIHNPVLTGKKLVWNPVLSPLSGHRLYRSGDVGRWLEDGNIQLKGRIDSQVKIRGFRVEPSEIESKILALDKVKDCVVVVKENPPNEKILVAYVVAHDIDGMEIKRHLEIYLPRYMIPKLVILESLPLMPNGKVDREKLPELPVESVKPSLLHPSPLVTAPRGQIKDFDSLPIPDRSLVNYDKYSRDIGLAMVRHTVALQASRGCPYNCLYCHKIWPKKHVFRYAANIFQEVELYYNMGVRRFVLVDDIFNLDVRNSSRFFEMVIKKGLDAHFFFPNGLRSDILTKDYIDLMAASGTKGIGMALESASPRIQRLLKKNLDLDKLRENAEYLCKKHPQIILELFLMHGFPTETEEEAIMTLEFLKALHWIDFPYLHILKIFPNTDMAVMAMENGVSAEAIARSAGLAFHELPETLPYAKSFTLKCQAEFLGDYFLSKERLLARLPHQMRVLTPEELVEKYDSYLPAEIKSAADVLEFAGIEPGQLAAPDENEAMNDNKVRAIDLDARIREHFAQPEADADALRVLLLDLSQFFSGGKKILYDGVEPPLGLMYLLTYLNRELGTRVKGKIAKSRVDFDSFDELKQLLEEFRPQVIGIRTLTYYSRFFHEAAANIRQWGFACPIITGGPYATSDYTTILKDPHVDVVVLSEGELTFKELIDGIISNQGQLPGDEALKEIAGLAFVPGNRAVVKGSYCGVFTMGEGNERGEGISSRVQSAVVGQGMRFENETEEKLARIWSELLGVDKGAIGRDDNFFELGGHSLKATTLMTRIHKEFNVRVKLIDIFKSPTIREVAASINRVSSERFAGIDPVEKKEYYVVSSAQERMYILQQMETAGTGYNMSKVMELEGEVDKGRLENAVNALIQRHEAFRTSFEIKNNNPVQIIQDKVEFEIESKVFAGGPGGQFFQKAPPWPPEAIIKSFLRPFDLSKAPLLRVGLIALPHTPAAHRGHPSQEGKEHKYILMVDMHHIISDGVSIDILIKDFMALYNGDELPAIGVQYKDYAEKQDREKREQGLPKQREYWRKEFEREIPVLDMPTDYRRPAIQSFEGNCLNFEMGSEIASSIKSLALETGATLYMVLLAIYSIFLAKISTREDIVIGTPVAGRRHADLEKIIGMFVNTLAIRTYPSGEKKFPEFLEEIKKKTLDSLENQDYQYENLVEELRVVRDASRNPLFDTLFVLQTAGRQIIEIPGLKIKSYEHENLTSKFDLSLIAAEAEEKLLFTFEYSTKLFEKETIERFIAYFENIVSGVLKDKYSGLSSMEIITEEEKKRILIDFNGTAAGYPGDKTIHRLFEDQVEQKPNQVALVGAAPDNAPESLVRPSNLTYLELNERSNRLAGWLIEKGVQPDTIVEIMVERSVEMVLGIMGILKAGGAYLPIEPDYPQERIDYMLKDSGAAVLLTVPTIEESINRSYQSYLSYFFSAFSASSAVKNFLPATGYRPPVPSLAYIIYTSGSTGNPKGVIVEHASVVNLLFAMQDEYPFTPGDTYLLKTSYIFDVSITELFGWYMGGGRLTVLEKGGEKDAQAILNSIERNGVSHINFVPSMFDVFLEQLTGKNKDRLSSLKYIFLAGEALLPQQVERSRVLNTRIRLENIYGPTEGTVYSSKYSLSARKENRRIPIGRPLPNIRLYILDNYNCLQPPGIVGELTIAGIGLSRGYLNHPELTAEKFIMPSATRGSFEKPPLDPAKLLFIHHSLSTEPAILRAGCRMEISNSWGEWITR